MNSAAEEDDVLELCDVQSDCYEKEEQEAQEVARVASLMLPPEQSHTTVVNSMSTKKKYRRTRHRLLRLCDRMYHHDSISYTEYVWAKKMATCKFFSRKFSDYFEVARMRMFADTVPKHGEKRRFPRASFNVDAVF